MNNPKRYPVEFTLGQVVDLLAELKSSYSASDYSTKRVLEDSVEENAEHSWVLSDAERGIEKRAVLAGLITQITGEPFGDPDEAAKITAAVKTVRDYIAAKETLDTVEV